jgi:hypothetical protein
MKYKIIHANSYCRLQNEVQEYLDLGWFLYSNLSVVGYNFSDIEFFQPMILDECKHEFTILGTTEIFGFEIRGACRKCGQK